MGQLEQKTPQERSDEEAEAKPTESEVVVLAEFIIQLYAPKIRFVYSLKGSWNELLQLPFNFKLSRFFVIGPFI
ncbi:hypothetical protein AM499_01120 [Bacillus sp. FJAT-22090]|nr:hypothetical protein AM499_01120 [Bacillus sp. FJAT-22090]